jgi:hypothetical protein
MGIMDVFESLADSLIGSLPLLGVYLWAWVRSRRLAGPAASQGARLRVVLLALVLLLFAVPLVFRALIAWLAPHTPEGRTAYVVANTALRLLSSVAYALCWYFILRMVLDSASQHESGERLEKTQAQVQ